MTYQRFQLMVIWLMLCVVPIAIIVHLISGNYQYRIDYYRPFIYAQIILWGTAALYGLYSLIVRHTLEGLMLITLCAPMVLFWIAHIAPATNSVKKVYSVARTVVGRGRTTFP